MTPRAYEDAVAKLIGRLVSGVELVLPGIEQRRKLTGKTGQAYEIDSLSLSSRWSRVSYHR